MPGSESVLFLFQSRQVCFLNLREHMFPCRIFLQNAVESFHLIVYTSSPVSSSRFVCSISMRPSRRRKRSLTQFDVVQCTGEFERSPSGPQFFQRKFELTGSGPNRVKISTNVRYRNNSRTNICLHTSISDIILVHCDVKRQKVICKDRQHYKYCYY